MFESREEYIEEFRKIDSRTRGVVRLNRGLEVDFSPRFLDSVGDFVNRAQWDILLCSVHEFGDGRDVERKTRTRGLTDQRNRWETYLPITDNGPREQLRTFQGSCAPGPDVERHELDPRRDQ